MAPQTPGIPQNSLLVPSGNFELQLRGDPSAKTADAGKLAELASKYHGNLKAEPLYTDSGKLAGYAVWGVKENPGLLSQIRHIFGIGTRRTVAVDAFRQAMRNTFPQGMRTPLYDKVAQHLDGAAMVEERDAAAVTSMLHNTRAAVPSTYAPNVMWQPPPAYNLQALRQAPPAPPSYQPSQQGYGAGSGYSPVPFQRHERIQQQPPRQQPHNPSYGVDVDPLTTQAIMDTGDAVSNAIALNPEVADTSAKVVGGMLFAIFDFIGEIANS